jgi:ElaB/YqjD/DUF883 family membrane-anchored ribosome-binding protein
LPGHALGQFDDLIHAGRQSVPASPMEHVMANSKLENNAADLAADLASLRADIAKLTATMSELARDQVASTGERVRAAAEDLRHEVSASATDAEARIKSASVELETTIERNPITAVLVAIMAGLLLGLWWRKS